VGLKIFKTDWNIIKINENKTQHRGSLGV
jgi:hypothetical protein